MYTVTIQGDYITDIPSFYQEVNRVFMADEEWQIGVSLDAFDDLLYGGFGILKDRDKVKLIWNSSEASRVALGLDSTKKHLQDKLDHPETFNTALIKNQLEDMEKGIGKTYFKLLVEIINSHPNLDLQLN